MKEITLDNKYIMHNSGLPVRIPPYMRQGLRQGDPMAYTQTEMMSNDPFVGFRNENDILPINMEENIRLRKIAHAASSELVAVAESLNSTRYSTIIHGSLSRGHIRAPSDHDPSDIDIQLVIDGLTLDKDQRRDIAKPMTRESSDKYGVKTDIHIWSLNDVLDNGAQLARTYLQSGAYSIANKKNVWEQIREIGLQCHLYLSQSNRTKKMAREIIALVAHGDLEKVKVRLSKKGVETILTYNYLLKAGLIDDEYSAKRALAILPVITSWGKLDLDQHAQQDL